MLKRVLSCVLTLALLLGGLALVPPAVAEDVSAKTTLSGSSKAKISNIKLACQALNGTWVASGSRFSFNDAVGARTKQRGYVSAINGRGVKVVGGGVSQVATTLYLALKKLGSDVSISKFMTYGKKFTDNYVSNGKDAVVTDYKAGHDFSFRNNGAGFTIAMWADSKNVYCTLTFDDDDYDDYDDYDDDGYAGGDGEGDNWFVSWGTSGSFRPVTMALSSSSLKCTGGSACANNIALAADSIYDTTLESGDLFSFNGVVGPRKSAYGYVTATNGRGVKVMGGGTAQVASVIWLAVRDMDDIAIVEKSTYGNRYNQKYVSNSADAIVVDYAADTDFSFRYTGEGSITLYTYVEDGVLFCDIYRN